MGWPTPKPLEGVKSKKRAIFKADGAEVSVAAGDEVVDGVPLVGMSLSLESRVAALGAGGRAAVELLLGDSGDAPGIFRQRGLVVTRLSPELAGAGADAEEHLAAVAEALRRDRPQLVVVDESLAGGAPGWAPAFGRLIRGEELKGFGGGVVLCCEEETFAIRRACTERWVHGGGKVRQEDGGNATGLQVIEDALLAAKDAAARGSADAGTKKRGKQRGGADADDELQALVEEAKSLSEFMFEENLVKKARKEGWTVTLLVSQAAGGGRSLCGYMCHKMLPAPRAEFFIERVAVSQKARGRGLGRQLMRWAMEEAARMPLDTCSSLTCSAFDWVVPFYGKFGFEVADCPEVLERDEEFPQTWMRRPNVSLV